MAELEFHSLKDSALEKTKASPRQTHTSAYLQNTIKLGLIVRLSLVAAESV